MHATNDIGPNYPSRNTKPPERPSIVIHASYERRNRHMGVRNAYRAACSIHYSYRGGKSSARRELRTGGTRADRNPSHLLIGRHQHVVRHVRAAGQPAAPPYRTPEMLP